MSKYASPSPIPNLNDLVVDHMHRDVARLQLGQTVGEALTEIRSNPPASRVIYFYVVDEHDHLQGVVPTRRLLLNPDTAAIRDIMITQVIAIPESATVMEACEFFLLHRLLAFPIVGPDRRLLGVVDVDLYTDELADLDRREDHQDLFQLIGVHVTDSQAPSSLLSFRQRFPWLLANIGGGILAAFLTGMFEAELEKAVSLALFIPVVLALAESVAIQSVSLTLQALHHRAPSWNYLWERLRQEALTGILLGISCALCVVVVALLWLQQTRVAACLLGGIAGGVTSAALIGVTIPGLLRLLNREPQVAAGPIALATTDMITLVIYFSLARYLLG